MYRSQVYDLKVHFWWPNKHSKHHVLRLNTLYILSFKLFQVKRQVNFGPLVSTKYFQLQDGIHKEIPNPDQKSKDHSFKNFKCGIHNLFFELNLYSFREVSNRHHLRPNPGTSDDMTVLVEVAKYLRLIAWFFVVIWREIQLFLLLIFDVYVPKLTFIE